MSSPVILRDHFGDNAPIVFDAARVVAITWRGSDYNYAVVTFDYGATLGIGLEYLGISCLGALANPDTVQKALDRLYWLIWDDIPIDEPFTQYIQERV